MRSRIIGRLLLTMPLSCCLPWAALRAADRPLNSLPAHLAESGIPTESEVGLVDAWLKTVAAGQEGGRPTGPWFDRWLGGGLPFSFRYEGRDFCGAGDAWQFHRGDLLRQADAETQD